MSDFTHLHVHTEFSMLDGMGSIEQYVERAVALEQSALAITDHGNLCGAPRFYAAARKANVEPIIGSEFYFVPDATVRNKGDEKVERCHVVLLARGARGYQVLSELSTETHRAFYYKPLLDVRMVEALGRDAKHLVCLSGCAASEISRAVLEDEYEFATERLVWWREAFPHFYVELQHHGTDFDRRLNIGLMELARRYNVPHVVTNDPHYVLEDEHEHHDALLAIQTASDRDDPERFRFDGTGYHLRSRVEMRAAFRRYGEDVWREGARHTTQIARMCHTRVPQWEQRSWHIPRVPGVEDPYAELRRLTLLGLRERGLEHKSEYRGRALRELKAFKESGVASTLLITLDCIRWATEQGIPVGPGRGSVCGTLVGYLIGIHKIDPVRYDLMFERFLNMARPSLPDIDTDFGPARRHELFTYVAETYGAENVVLVAAYQNMRLKSAFKSLAKSYGVPYVQTNRLAKLLPDVLPDEGDDESADYEWPEDFREQVLREYPDLEATLRRLSGLKRAVSAHPAGVIIADPNDHVRMLVPEMWLPSSKRMCGQYDLDAVDHMGLMKQDFLGLRTLETIAECVRLVEESTGEVLDPDAWVPDDEPRDDEVYAMLARGECAGVFQMEGPTNASGIRAVKPTEFEDIVSATSLYRTGAISAGFPRIFLHNRKRGRDEINYAHPALQPILERTWGVVLYQEQVMEMGERIAGFSMAQVDDIKEAIKHKRSTLMRAMGPQFVRGAQRNVGATREQAREMWRMIEGYSGYGYNRSHAVAYSFITYQTARLKTLYPREFIAALLRTVPTGGPGKVKRQTYLVNAVAQGMRIEAPHINESDALATPTARGIRFGFTDIAGIGPSVAKRIIDNRPPEGYDTVEQVEEAVNNVGVMKALRGSGALRTLGLRGKRSEKSQLLGWEFHDPLADLREKHAPLLVLPEQIDDYSKESVHIYGDITMRTTSGMTKPKNGETKGKPYATFHVRVDQTHTYNIRCWSETQELWDAMQIGAYVRVIGRWEDEWENVGVGSPTQIRVIRRARQRAA